MSAGKSFFEVTEGVISSRWSGVNTSDCLQVRSKHCVAIAAHTCFHELLKKFHSLNIAREVVAIRVSTDDAWDNLHSRNRSEKSCHF